MKRPVAGWLTLVLCAFIALGACKGPSSGPTATPTPPPVAVERAATASPALPTVVTPAATQAPVATAVALGATPASFSGARALEEDRVLAQDIGIRPAGSANADRAADYIASRLASFGWQVEKQAFKFTGYVDQGSIVTVTGGDLSNLEASTLTYSAAGDLTAPIVSVGLGQAADYAGLNVRGKIALVERGTITFAMKVQNAADQGAAGVLLFNNADGLVRGTLGKVSAIPVASISRADGLALRALRAPTVHLIVRGEVKETNTMNIVGALPGQSSDTLVFGGHYDGVPAGPAANDNGSGVSTALEAARVLALQGPHRLTFRFIAFGAEENGLFGSRAYVDGLSAAQRKQIVAMINLDMVGVGDTWMAGGTRDLQKTVQSIAGSLGIDMQDLPADLSGASDHASFINAGIPAAFIYSSDDPNYHSPQDKVEFVQPARLEAAGKLLIEIIGRFDKG